VREGFGKKDKNFRGREKKGGFRGLRKGEWGKTFEWAFIIE
jgi:hypothetical protein